MVQSFQSNDLSLTGLVVYIQMTGPDEEFYPTVIFILVKGQNTSDSILD